MFSYGPGHPQCRRNDIIVGFPSAGTVNRGQEGALFPIFGTGAIWIGEGENHDENSLEILILTEFGEIK